MVITLLGGISDKLAHCAPTISAARPPMHFNAARSFLQQEEAWITDRANKVVSTALLAARSNTSTTTASATAPSAPPSQNTGGDRPRKRKKQASRNGNNTTSSSTTPSESRGGNVPSWVNPWTGVVQAWPLGQLPTGSSSVGVLGACPGAAPP
ncbi:unnamed protein product [Urochloa humidicola]